MVTAMERHLQSAATAQGVEQVFDPNYVPATAEDIELFNEKQKFGCQILEQTVQTQEGMIPRPRMHNLCMQN
jgi:hypothetical protein